MPEKMQCGTDQAAKWIRVIVSLAIIGAGIYFRNWLGLLGVITLLSAFTGSCPLCLHFGDPEDPRRVSLTGLRIRHRRDQDKE